MLSIWLYYLLMTGMVKEVNARLLEKGARLECESGAVCR